MIRRQCTGEYKIKPIERLQRKLAGYEPKQRIPAGTIETWRQFSARDECACYDDCSCPPTGTYVFRADYDDDEVKWKPSIFMPKEAARLFISIDEVRAERLQDISERDAKAERAKPLQKINSLSGLASLDAGIEEHERYKAGFRILWDSINGKPKNNKPDVSWRANPWVFAYTFSIKEIRQPVAV